MDSILKYLLICTIGGLGFVFLFGYNLFTSEKVLRTFKSPDQRYTATFSKDAIGFASTKDRFLNFRSNGETIHQDKLKKFEDFADFIDLIWVDEFAIAVLFLDDGTYYRVYDLSQKTSARFYLRDAPPGYEVRFIGPAAQDRISAYKKVEAKIRISDNR